MEYMESPYIRCRGRNETRSKDRVYMTGGDDCIRISDAETTNHIIRRERLYREIFESGKSCLLTAGKKTRLFITVVYPHHSRILSANSHALAVAYDSDKTSEVYLRQKPEQYDVTNSLEVMHPGEHIVTTNVTTMKYKVNNLIINLFLMGADDKPVEIMLHRAKVIPLPADAVAYLDALP